MIKLGLCCGGGVCCAVLSGFLWVAGSAAVSGEPRDGTTQTSVGCSKAGCTKNHATDGAPCGAVTDDAAGGELTADEQKVVTYLVDMIEAGKAPMVTSDELGTELGLSIEAIEHLNESRLRAAVMAELSHRDFDLASLGGNCSKFSACSVDHNLMNATGDELERYRAEVATDGTSFSDRMAPDFTLPNTEGEQVSLSDHRGKNVAVVFLSAHCFHSLDTLPILAALKEKYADQDLEILPVFINSGDVEDLVSRAWEWSFEHPLLVSEGKEISEAYDSRMVPSTFLIDEQGRLTRKLVGFKDQATLDRAFGELVGS